MTELKCEGCGWTINYGHKYNCPIGRKLEKEKREASMTNLEKLLEEAEEMSNLLNGKPCTLKKKGMHSCVNDGEPQWCLACQTQAAVEKIAGGK